MEHLEERELMASHLTANLSGGVLRIEGTSHDDRIVVRQINNRILVETTAIQVQGKGNATGVRADAVSSIQVRALAGNDTVLLGTDATSGPNALRKSTTVWAGSGSDLVRGSQGVDRVHGEGGNDKLYGRGGKDILDGGNGNDRVDGGAGGDQLKGGSGNDYLYGGSGKDRLEGGTGNDRLYGGHDNDRLDGGSGRNQLSGEAGNDAIYSRSRLDTVNGGSGRDMAYFLAASAPQSSTGDLAWAITSIEDYNGSHTKTSTAAPSHSPFQAQIDRLLSLTNSYRRSKGLPALTVDPRLQAAAQYQASYMARTGHYAHDNLDGRDLGDRVHAAGYDFSVAAENIHLYDPDLRRTYGINRVYSESELAQYFFDGWKVSPSHQHNLLSREVRQIGIAFAEDSQGRIYAVQDFGSL
jgi:uncharacterized protein YkwD